MKLCEIKIIRFRIRVYTHNMKKWDPANLQKFEFIFHGKLESTSILVLIYIQIKSNQIKSNQIKSNKINALRKSSHQPF